MYEILHLTLNHTAPVIATTVGLAGFAGGLWMLVNALGSSDFKADASA